MKLSTMIALAALAAFPAMPLRGDTVLLKNGKQIRGVVSDDGGTKIAIKTERMDQWIPRDQIQQIRRESPSDFYIQLGRKKLELKDVDAARGAFKQALDVDPACEAARKELDAIQAMTLQQRAKLEKSRREANIQQLLAEARRLLDRALDEEALDVLRVAVEKDPNSAETLALAAQTSLRTWIRFKTPETLLEQYLTMLEKASPQNPVIAQVKEGRDIFNSKRQINAARDKQRLYDEIMQAHALRQYDYRLLNQIDRLLEMNPNDSMKARLALVQEAAKKAGIGRIGIAVSSSTTKSTTEQDGQNGQNGLSGQT